jgi:7-carboxy-7-deazaguanine synthase
VPYSVKEVFYTLQGEGFHAGTPAVFCRFSGCNLWSGREQDRDKGKGGCAAWCDTDFVGGTKYEATELAQAVYDAFHEYAVGSWSWRRVVLTGGEPLLQVDAELLSELKRLNFWIAVETNGTQPVPEGIDWVCVSPKAGAEAVVRAGNELKLVMPQTGFHPSQFVEWRFDHWFLQPKDGPEREEATRALVDFCRTSPRWRLSTQTHKFLNIR